ncbi:MAG: TolC family protein [Acidobacteriota bacterium]
MVRVRAILRFGWALTVVAAGSSTALASPEPQALWTVDDVLRDSRSANGRLPIALFDVAIAREKVSEARAERWLKVALEGDFIYAPPNGYDPAVTNAGETRLQVVGRQPIYDGGARRARVLRNEADVDVAGARYRVAEKDLELDVRSRYAEAVQADAEAAARREGALRLGGYRTSLESRRASGQGVAADLLKVDVRLATEQAAIVDAEGRRDQAKVVLNVLMGREPDAPLALAPLPPPDGAAVPEGLGIGFDRVPEVARAAAEAKSAEADLEIARAERKPHVLFSGDVGFLGSDTSRLVPADLRASDPDANFGDRIHRDLGYSFTLSLSLPIWDAGAIRSRVRQAELRLQSAERGVAFQKQESRRQSAQALASQRNIREQIRILSDAAPSARDSYLEAESRYRGGAATSLEVLDAYAASVDAAVRLSEALSRYRIAQAVAQRWSTP